ncbi:hypothetical protein [Clostridium sp. UBA1056]
MNRGKEHLKYIEETTTSSNIFPGNVWKVIDNHDSGFIENNYIKL